MDGREIFKFVIRTIPSSIYEVLKKNNMKMHDIKHVIFHQANAKILYKLQKIMNISKDQLIVDLQKQGNTVSSTIPIALKHLENQGKLVSGDILLFSGFGVGMSWGNVIYRWV